ncbi:hypothetical protein C2G38_2063051 [Gigaspora rosea]|uniref:Uncharacterized protein n=1 Tax=Gigaspora rosea TaxID=44941 RepID=A0A397W439_9GLOM|nr:hypothetical protein C2G38_2063051 [Gigaspora rosea]
MERYKDAIIDLTKFLDIEPNNKFAIRYRGEAYYITGRCVEAIIDLKKKKLLDIEQKTICTKYLGKACHLAKEAIIDLANCLVLNPVMT